jgi:hypothetical protein
VSAATLIDTPPRSRPAATDMAHANAWRHSKECSADRADRQPKGGRGAPGLGRPKLHRHSWPYADFDLGSVPHGPRFSLRGAAFQLVGQRLVTRRELKGDRVKCSSGAARASPP